MGVCPSLSICSHDAQHRRTVSVPIKSTCTLFSRCTIVGAVLIAGGRRRMDVSGYRYFFRRRALQRRNEDTTGTLVGDADQLDDAQRSADEGPSLCLSVPIDALLSTLPRARPVHLACVPSVEPFPSCRGRCFRLGQSRPANAFIKQKLAVHVEILR